MMLKQYDTTWHEALDPQGYIYPGARRIKDMCGFDIQVLMSEAARNYEYWWEYRHILEPSTKTINEIKN